MNVRMVLFGLSKRMNLSWCYDDDDDDDDDDDVVFHCALLMHSKRWGLE